jgi:AcrR family transcriptional regulator
METPTTKSERTRQRIITRALDLFQHEGYEKATMRAIADACDLSPGAAYYYFKSKEELVYHWYTLTGEESSRRNVDTCTQTTDIRTRLLDALTFKLDQLAPYRGLVGVLARQASDFQGDLSPFSDKTQPVREEAIGLLATALEGSNVKVASALRPHLPKLLWLYQMGIILYWANDTTPDQVRSRQLLDLSLTLILRLLQATTMPFMRTAVKRAVSVIELAESCTAPAEEATS